MSEIITSTVKSVDMLQLEQKMKIILHTDGVIHTLQAIAAVCEQVAHEYQIGWEDTRLEVVYRNYAMIAKDAADKCY